MKFQSLGTCNIDEIASIFNAVYEDYVVPIAMTADLAESHIHANSIDLDRSPLWLDDDGSLVATALLGVRDDHGWVGGFGVTTPYRGRGISHRLIAAIIDQATTLHLRDIALEVMTTNTAAIRTYQRAGFVHQRNLLIFVRQPAPLDPDIDTSAVTTADPRSLLSHRPSNAAVPVWQRDSVSLAHATGLCGLAIGSENSPTATVHYTRQGSTSVRIADIAAASEDAAQTILAALIEREPDAAISLVNEPEESKLVGAAESLGWKEVMRQHEMLYTFGADLESRTT